MTRVYARRLAFSTVMAVACTGATDVCGCPPLPPVAVVVTGRVTDAGGAPVAGARVAVDAVPAIFSSEPIFHFIDPTTTGADGAFVTRALATYGPGPMSLRASVVRAGTTDTARVRLPVIVQFDDRRSTPDTVNVTVSLP